MKAYIIQTNKKIEPFQEKIGKLLIKNKKLEDLQKEAVLNSGLTLVAIKDFSEINDDKEYIVFGDEVYFEPELLKEFINKSRKLNCKTVCALKPGIFTLKTIVKTQEVKNYNDRIEYNLYYYPHKNLRGQLKPVIFDLDQNLENLPLPKHMSKDGKYLIPLTDKPIVQIDHWANLWSANLISVLSIVAHFQKISKFRILACALKKHSFNKWKIASSLNTIGKNCDIHPTAYVEGSIIGDNTIIGAGSVVKESIIGKDSLVGNGIIIESSVVGENCTILNGHILFSVLYPNTFSVSHIISVSLIGKNSFIGGGVSLSDFRFDGKTISVIKDDKKIDTGHLFLGCCLGNNVYLGAGCIIAPGRIVPNDLRISPDEERIITKFDINNLSTGFRIIK